MAYHCDMVTIETEIFTKRIQELMDDDQYVAFQAELIRRPDLRDLIPGGGGLRKVGWRLEGQGKRGGVRVIYYWVSADYQIRMLYAYKKTTQDNLTPEQLKALRQIVERW